MNSHIVAIASRADLADIESELGNVLGYDADQLDLLAVDGCIYVPRTDALDAETLVEDVLASRRRRPHARLQITMHVVSPAGAVLRVAATLPGSDLHPAALLAA